MKTFADLVSAFDSFLWGIPLLVLLVGGHLFLTFRLKFIQRYIPLAIRLSLQKDPNAVGEISHYGALSIALAATIGTGNIIGVATAIVLGGPGAVFWCWLCGIFGIATKYGETLLSVKYRFVGEDGFIRGGPMYVMERAMHCKPLAICFAVFTLMACTGIGSMVQSNAVSGYSAEVFHIPPTATGILEAILIAAIVWGGLKFISRVCGTLVPFMAILYVLGCFTIIIINYQTLLPALKLIITSAFSLKAIGGGFFGTMLMMALRYGVARGLFSNESGLGSAPMIAASAKSANPVRQALISSSGTFWDTVCVCALTGVAIVSTVLHHNPDADFTKFKAIELPRLAFSQIPYVGEYVLGIALVIFAYTTIIGWFCYGRQAVHYLGGNKLFQVYRPAYILLVFGGAVLNLELVWNISDIANGLMAIPNIISLFALSKVIYDETKYYLWEGRLDETDPECAKVNATGAAEEEL